jgi:hypothetical protein
MMLSSPAVTKCQAPAELGPVGSFRLDLAEAHSPTPRLSSSSCGCGLTSRAARTYSRCTVATKPASTFWPGPASSRWAGSPVRFQLAKLVAGGELRYVLRGGRGGGPGGEGNPNVTAWVTKTCTVVTDSKLGISDLYDCRAR